jgi:hypothetical protein
MLAEDMRLLVQKRRALASSMMSFLLASVSLVSKSYGRSQNSADGSCAHSGFALQKRNSKLGKHRSFYNGAVCKPDLCHERRYNLYYIEQ